MTIIYNQNYYTRSICSIFAVMKPLNEIGCPEMILLFIPIILYGIWYNWSEKQKELKRQNKERERNNSTQRKGTEPFEKLHIPIPAVKKQVSLVPTSVCREWFITDWGNKSVPSEAEQRIIEELDKYQVEWYREVSFKPFMTPAGGHYRYDFFIPSLCTCIEYHGSAYHCTEEQIANDKIKEEFCSVNNIKLLVYRRKDYYNMYGHINSLMREASIKKKTATSRT